MKQPIVSVIIPVYKAEKYLSRCLDSFLNQTFKDFEVVLVDDGSPDSSGEICDIYAQKDMRFKVIHQDNGGVSSARQTGLNNAKGEYVIHTDPDDWVDSDMLQVLFNTAVLNNADLVLCDFFMTYKNKEVYINQKPKRLNHLTLLKQLLGQELHGSCCNKLVRRSLFEKYNITFPQDIIRWEDLWVNCLLLFNPIQIAYVNKAFYHYDQCVNTESIVRKVSKKAVESQIKFCEHLDLIIESTQIDLKNELYKCKSATKELMYISKLYSEKEVIDKFASINTQYISLNSNFCLAYLTPYCLSLLLKGKVITSRVLIKIYSCIISPLVEILRRLMFRM